MKNEIIIISILVIKAKSGKKNHFAITSSIISPEAGALYFINERRVAGFVFFSLFIFNIHSFNIYLSSSSAHIFFPSFDDSGDDVALITQTEQQDKFQYIFNFMVAM